MLGLSPWDYDKVVDDVSLVNNKRNESVFVVVFLRKKIDGLACRSNSGKNNLSGDLMFGTPR